MKFSHIKKFKLTTFFQAFLVISIASTAGYALYAQGANSPSITQTNVETKFVTVSSLLATTVDTQTDFPIILNTTPPPIVNTINSEPNQNTATTTAPITTNSTTTEQPSAQENNNSTTTTATEKPIKKTITVQLKASGPNVAYNSKIEVAAGSTVQTVMNTAKQQGFRYSVSQNSSLGAFVESIQGVSTNKDTEMYWIYRVNGAVAIAGISSYVIKSGDVISWTYEKSY